MRILIFSLMIILSFGCSESINEPSSDNDFAIYLVKDVENNTPLDQNINKLKLEDTPILSLKNIESYTWNSHKISFSDEAKEEIKTQEPLYGQYFVVTVRDERIYWGLFTYHISSSSCNNPVIIVASTHGLKESHITNEFYIERGYPSYNGNPNDPDLREDLRIYNALQKSDALN